jgi:hypothetical protein
MAATKDVLVDCPDGPEEYAWVRVEVAGTPEEAVNLAREQEPLAEENWFYECTGRSWFCPESEVEVDGSQSWQPCEAADEGAVEFWDLIVSELEHPNV